VNLARRYRLPFSVVLTWSAVDVVIAAWSCARADVSADYARHRVALYAGNVNAVAFAEPSKLTQVASDLRADAPAWDQQSAPKAMTFDEVFDAMQAQSR
jgi:hypothetical protein